MKRKLLLGSALTAGMLAYGAGAQVVNFHDAANGFVSLPTVGYNALFAGQGVYPDPGNNIWNGFGSNPGKYQSTYFYSDQPAADGGGTGPWPQAAGNPGNPYAWFGGTTSTGPNLFNFTTGSATVSGDSTSAGQWTPITLSVSINADNGGIGGGGASGNIQNGSPTFLLGEAGLGTGNNPATFTLQNVPAGKYGLYIYDANFNNDRGASFSLETTNGGVAHNGINTTVNEDNPDGQPDPNGFVEGGNFVIFENVVPDANSNIVITGTSATNPHSGNSGEVDVNGIQLVFNPLPTEVGLNAASNVLSGQNAAFSFSPVFADESTATPGYQWQFSSDGGNTWANVGANSSSLTITGATGANAGLYHCVITDNVTSVVGTTPPASLGIITSATNILQVGDTLLDISNNIVGPGNTVPAPIYVSVSDVEDQTLFKYENFGVNGNSTTTGFTGPAGFIVAPKVGNTVVSGIRIFTASTHPEADPINYTLQGSTSGTNGPWTTLSSGSLALPLTRNAGGGPINLNNQALQEIDFANSQYAGSYRLTFNDTRNDAQDSNGVQVAEVQLLGIVAGAPAIVQNPAPSLSLVPACPVGVPLTFSVTAGGTGPFTYQWIENGTTVVQTGSSASYTFDAQPGTNTYAVTVSGPISPSATSASVTVIGLTTPPPVLTLNAATDWTVNSNGNYAGGAPNITSGTLKLTDGGGGEMTSGFYNTPQYIGGFITSFLYTDVGLGGGADGVTFCLQNDPKGTNALGTSGSGGGGGLGFDAISSSFAFEMDIYTHAAAGPGGNTDGPGIAVGVNGSTPYTTSPAASTGYFSTGPVDIASGDPIQVQLYYTSGVLQVYLEDTTTLDSFSTNVTINLPATVGASSAYVGFTGADGGVTSTQTISDFAYSYTTAPILSVANGSPGNVVVSWPVSIATMFTLYQSSSLTGPWTAANMSSLTQSDCENQVTLPTSGTNQFYLLSNGQP